MKYIFAVKKGEEIIGAFEMESDKEITIDEASEEFLNSIKKNNVTDIFTWKGNFFDREEIKTLVVTLQSRYTA